MIKIKLTDLYSQSTVRLLVLLLLWEGDSEDKNRTVVRRRKRPNKQTATELEVELLKMKGLPPILKLVEDNTVCAETDERVRSSLLSSPV